MNYYLIESPKLLAVFKINETSAGVFGNTIAFGLAVHAALKTFLSCSYPLNQMICQLKKISNFDNYIIYCYDDVFFIPEMLVLAF